MTEIESKFLEAARRRRSSTITHTTKDGLMVIIKSPEYKDTLKIYGVRDKESEEFLIAAADVLAECIISPSLDSSSVRQAMMIDNPGRYVDEVLIPKVEVLYYLFPNPLDIIEMVSSLLDESSLTESGMKHRIETAKN